MHTQLEHPVLPQVKKILSIYDEHFKHHINESNTPHSAYHDFFSRRLRSVCRELNANQSDHVYQKLLSVYKNDLNFALTAFQQAKKQQQKLSTVLNDAQDSLLSFVEFVEAREENLIDRAHPVQSLINDHLSL